MTRKTNLKPSKDKPVIEINAAYAINNGLVPFGEKAFGRQILMEYGKALKRKLLRGESYSIVFDESYSTKKKIINLLIVQKKTKIGYLKHDKESILKHFLIPRLNIAMHTFDDSINREKIIFKQSIEARKSFAKLPIVELSKFPKE